MVIAVTGASGQVGTLVCRRLAEGSIEVLPLKRGDDWTDAIGKSEAVIHLAGTLKPEGRNSYDSAMSRRPRPWWRRHASPMSVGLCSSAM